MTRSARVAGRRNRTFGARSGRLANDGFEALLPALHRIGKMIFDLALAATIFFAAGWLGERHALYIPTVVLLAAAAADVIL
jgi:hypothetical protein